MSAMGQVIAFPGKREKKVVVTDDRRAAVITGLCALTFLMGFFIAGPMLALFAFSYTSHRAPAAGALLRRRAARRLADHALRVQTASRASSR